MGGQIADRKCIEYRTSSNILNSLKININGIALISIIAKFVIYNQTHFLTKNQQP